MTKFLYLLDTVKFLEINYKALGNSPLSYQLYKLSYNFLNYPNFQFCI